jgi:hypothetical protein
MGPKVDLENCHARAVVGPRSLPLGRYSNFGRCRHRHSASVDTRTAAAVPRQNGDHPQGSNHPAVKGAISGQTSDFTSPRPNPGQRYWQAARRSAGHLFRGLQSRAPPDVAMLAGTPSDLLPRESRAFLIGVSGSSLPREPSASRTASNAPPLFRAKGNPARNT